MWAFLIVATMVALYAGRTDAFCGRTPTVWRNNNITCPERAVCADVFKTPRDWYNGTTCEEERVLHNCLCSGGIVCPFTNSAHLLYATALHLQYTCQQSCQLPFCGNVRQRQAEGRSSPTVAQTLEQNSPEFGGRNYYRMSCRCPRNHEPIRRTGGVFRSVHAHSHTYDYRQHRYITHYVCTTGVNETMAVDPCSDPSISQQ